MSRYTKQFAKIRERLMLEFSKSYSPSKIFVTINSKKELIDLDVMLQDAFSENHETFNAYNRDDIRGSFDSTSYPILIELSPRYLFNVSDIDALEYIDKQIFLKSRHYARRSSKNNYFYGVIIKRSVNTLSFDSFKEYLSDEKKESSLEIKRYIESLSN